MSNRQREHTAAVRLRRKRKARTRRALVRAGKMTLQGTLYPAGVRIHGVKRDGA